MDQSVEWRQQRGASFETRGSGLGVDSPRAGRSLDLRWNAGVADELRAGDTEGAQQPLAADHASFAEGDYLCAGWVDPLGQVPHTLAAAATGDGDLAA
jgi:hypothetical protein